MSGMSATAASVRTALDLRLMLVTDTAQCGSRGVVRTVREAVAGGVTVVQVRDKTASTRDLLALVEAVTGASGDAAVLVDDRVDVYLAARSRGCAVAGVHVGQDDLPVDVVRDLVGPDAVVGLTAHRPEHLATVAALPAGTVDYLGVGTLRATSSKADHPPPLGIEGMAAVFAATPLPCVAIGGVGPADVDPLRDAGAAGIAVVSEICRSARPGSAAASLREEWDR